MVPGLVLSRRHRVEPLTAGYDIALIGAGRVGQTLGRLFAALGHRLTIVACRTRAAAEQAVAFIGTGQPTTYDKAPLDVVQTGHGVVCITTPDDAIAPTAVQLAQRQPRWHGVVVLHCSGALSSTVLHVLRPWGAQVGSMHPLYAFGTAIAEPEILRGVYWCIEGDTAAKHVARRLIGDLRGHVSEIQPEHKMLYHAAAAVAGNLITGLMGVSFSMLAHCGIAPDQARAMLIRLSEGVLQRIKAEGEVVALAGPISRGDVATVAQHLAQLHMLPPVYEAVYRSLSRELVTLARRKGAAPAAALADIEKLLQG
jgi:predicted short-subunit dehydrogenase-like oxidoreductase (DUF2520 family)